ncbi:hypothetical protein ACLB2K_076729 [Fragaria x ananassa]
MAKMELGRMCLKHVHSIAIMVLLLHISCGASANVTRCVEREREALLAIKQDLMVNSSRLSSWGSAAKDCCKWEGILCDHLTGHVIQLHLGGWVLSWQGEFEDYIPFEVVNIEYNNDLVMGLNPVCDHYIKEAKSLCSLSFYIKRSIPIVLVFDTETQKTCIHLLFVCAANSEVHHHGVIFKDSSQGRLEIQSRYVPSSSRIT